MKFRKKPVVIEAIQFTDCENPELGSPKSVASFCAEGNVVFEISQRVFKIQTLEGEMAAKLNDWIIKGVNGEFYPCKPDIFEKTYEKVEE